MLIVENPHLFWKYSLLLLVVVVLLASRHHLNIVFFIVSLPLLYHIALRKYWCISHQIATCICYRRENCESVMSTEDNANGPKPVKLPYFHRTLNPEDAALIGDITPKPLSSGNATPSPNDNSNKGSAWNAANTWEERDFTSAAKQKLFEALSTTNNNIGINGITLEKVEKVEGSASITHVRGRARYMYEWSFALEFEANGGSKGSCDVSDVINDQLDDIELEVKWKAPAPAKENVKALKESLKKEIIRRVKLFEESYRSLL